MSHAPTDTTDLETLTAQTISAQFSEVNIRYDLSDSETGATATTTASCSPQLIIHSTVLP
eukprot:SAG11_NODE_1477_length_4837_cov_2.462431_6_plen_60_part_00